MTFPPRNAAEYARMQDWDVGAVLYGHPIVRNDVEIERDRVAIITAIGQESVLAVTKVGDQGRWSAEHLLSFDSRRWDRLTAPESDDSSTGG